MIRYTYLGVSIACFAWFHRIFSIHKYKLTCQLWCWCKGIRSKLEGSPVKSDIVILPSSGKILECSFTAHHNHFHMKILCFLNIYVLACPILPPPFSLLCLFPHFEFQTAKSWVCVWNRSLLSTYELYNNYPLCKAPDNTSQLPKVFFLKKVSEMTMSKHPGTRCHVSFQKTEKGHVWL